MLEKGDLKFRLHGNKLNGEFVLAKMRSRRPGSKGTEWLLIKHRDSAAAAGYDIDKFADSVLTGRSLDEIAADAASPEWKSSRPVIRAEMGAAGAGKNAWLAASIAAHDRQQAPADAHSRGVRKKRSADIAVSKSKSAAAGKTAVPARETVTRETRAREPQSSRQSSNAARANSNEIRGQETFGIFRQICDRECGQQKERAGRLPPERVARSRSRAHAERDSSHADHPGGCSVQQP